MIPATLQHLHSSYQKSNSSSVAETYVPPPEVFRQKKAPCCRLPYMVTTLSRVADCKVDIYPFSLSPLLGFPCDAEKLSSAVIARST